MESVEQLRPIFRGLSNAELSKVAQLRHRARTDHFYLANEICGFWFQTDVHTDLFAVLLEKNPELSFLDQDMVKNRLILWPRGHYKSTAKAVEVVQLILNFPNIRILLMTGTQELASEGLQQIKGFFEGTSEAGKRLKSLFPEFCGKDLGNKGEFTVPCRTGNLREPTVKISTIGTTKAGSHYDVLFLDDVVTELNSLNRETAQSVIDAYMHCLPLLDPGGYLYLIGTRYSFDDLYGWIQDCVERDGDKTWKISQKSCWTYNEASPVNLLFPQRRLKTGELIGFSFDQLKTLQRNNPAWFSCQYENNPIGGGLEIFPEALIDRHTAPFEKTPKTGPVIVVWDLASGQGDDADDSVGIAGRIGGNGAIYVLEARAGKFNPYELVQHILDMLFKWRPIRLGIEKSVGAVYLLPSLEAEARKHQINMPLEWILPRNTKGAKNARIMSLQALLVQDRLWFLAGIENYQKLYSQFTKYPKTKHDDFPDAISLLLEIAPQLASASGNKPLTPEQDPAWALIYEQQPETKTDDWSILGGLGGGLTG